MREYRKLSSGGLMSPVRKLLGVEEVSKCVSDRFTLVQIVRIFLEKIP